MIFLLCWKFNGPITFALSYEKIYFIPGYKKMEVGSEVILQVITKLVHLCFHPFILKLFSMIYLAVFTLTVYVCACMCMCVYVCACILHVHMCMS